MISPRRHPKEALARVPGFQHPRKLTDVILGCASPEGEQGMNVARIAALRRTSRRKPSAMTIQPLCSPACRPSLSPPNPHPLFPAPAGSHRSLRHRVHVHGAHGRQQNLSHPCSSTIIRRLHQTWPRHRKYRAPNSFHPRNKPISSPGRFSTRKLCRHRCAGNFKDETIPVEVKITALPKAMARPPKPKAGTLKPSTQTFIFATDELPRADTISEVLANIKTRVSAPKIGPPQATVPIATRRRFRNP